jgi:hypothetical protein
MLSAHRQRTCSARSLSRLAIAAIGLASIVGLGAVTQSATAKGTRIVPAIGSYKAAGRGDPPRYAVRAQVKRKAGRKVISIQVEDTCRGFATFAPTAISRASGGAPVFSARVGAARVGGRWTSSTTIEGVVKTACATRQGYVMHLTN